MLGASALGEAPLGDEPSSVAEGTLLTLLPFLTVQFTDGTVRGDLVATLPKPVAGIISSVVLVLELNAARLPTLTGSMGGDVYPAGYIDAPRLTTLAGAMAGGEFNLYGTLPSVLTGSLSGHVTIQSTVSAALYAPTAFIVGAGIVAGTVDADLIKPRATISGSVTNVGRVSARLTRTDGLLSGHVATAGAIAAIFPLVTSTGSGSARIAGTVTPRLTNLASFIRGGAPSLTTPIRAVYVVNTKTMALSEYAQFQFTSFIEFRGKLYATGTGGLYELTGKLDVANEIVFEFATGKHDFKTPNKKHLRDVIAALRADTDVTLRVGTDDEDTYEYTIATYGAVDLKQRRAQIGRGLYGRYFRFEFAGTGAVDIADLNIEVDTTSRRL